MTSPDFLIILGRQPEFGLLELESRFGQAISRFSPDIALNDVQPELTSLGGALKVGRILYMGEQVDLGAAVPIAELPVRDSKLNVALSMYGSKVMARQLLKQGLELKRRLREQGQSVRLIVPNKGSAVSAAQLKFNRVLETGLELLVAYHGTRMVVAMTTSVQDIDAYAQRDHGRPVRSAVVGMLPPKLAQIMINSTTASTIVDPFCGTGVVLQEALLLGRRAVGSDLSAPMVGASRANLQWLETQYPETVAADAWSVLEPVDSRQVKLPSVPLAIVSEGYLGPNLSSPPSSGQIEAMRRELQPLYREALRNFAAQLPAGSEVSITLPAWRHQQGWQYLEVLDDLQALGYTMRVLQLTKQPLLYARPDQVVGRQLLLLRKI